jgi:hypothetical protein
VFHHSNLLKVQHFAQEQVEGNWQGKPSLPDVRVVLVKPGQGGKVSCV